MKLATSTGDFDRFCDTYLERIKHVYSAGFKYIDLSLYTVMENDPLILSDDWQRTVEEIKAYAQASNLQFIQCHSPNTNPLDKKQFEKAVRWNVRAIEICGALGIPNMVVHSGWDRNATKEEWFKRNKAFFEQLFDAMEKNNVNILHENTSSANMPWFYPKTGKDMLEFSNYVDHPMFHSCWDTGHANLEGNQYDEILTIGSDLYAIHLNDNRGTQDEHIIPYFGTLNIDEIMHALKEINYKGIFTFEAGSTLRPKKYWLGNRREFNKDTRLSEPTLEMQSELEKFMYLVGKHILSSYDEFED